MTLGCYFDKQIDDEGCENCPANESCEIYKRFHRRRVRLSPFTHRYGKKESPKLSGDPHRWEIV